MKQRPVETRIEALDAIGRAWTKGRIGFAEATKMRDLTRRGRMREVKQQLGIQDPTRRA